MNLYFKKNKMISNYNLLILAIAHILFFGCTKRSSQVSQSESVIKASIVTTDRVQALVSQTKVNADGSVIPLVKGQIAGSCLMAYDSKYKASQVDPNITWPMLSCDLNDKQTCAPGFKPLKDAPVQMNCSTTPSANLLNCYWNNIRCVSTEGSTDLKDFIRGKSYGGCIIQADSAFRTTGNDSVAWPMLSCDIKNQDMNPICAAGFKAIKDAPVQMNCSSTPSKSDMKSCFWMAYRCARL